MAFVLLGLLQAANSGQTLVEYLAAHPQPSTVIIGPERFRTRERPTGLATFGVRVQTVGAVTAIVPQQMVRFNLDVSQPPNLYDGLSMNDKVLYLLTTLDSRQWQLATGRGIGLKDLNTQQAPVMRSLLPQPFRWERSEIGESYTPEKRVDSGELSAEETAGVRLRVCPKLQLQVQFKDEQGSYTLFDVPAGASPGGEQITRDNGRRWNHEGSFGKEFVSRVPTAVKPGDLNTKGLQAPVRLVGVKTLGDALQKTARATNLRLAADVRARDLSFSGPDVAPAGDLLDAIALSVGGTYRKLGDTTILVPDAVGVGSVALFANEWIASAEIEARKMADNWRAELAKQGFTSRLKWAPNDPLAPSDTLQKRLDRDIQQSQEPFPATELSGPLRDALAGFVGMYKNQPMREDVVNAEVNYGYQFVMPSGQATAPEGYLGGQFQFTPPKEPRGMAADPVFPKVALGKGPVRDLAVQLDSVEAVDRAVKTLRKFGFRELWVSTDRSHVLQRAIASGVPTRLLVWPWRAPAMGSDRTALGDSGSQLGARLANSRVWNETDEMIRGQRFPRIGPHLISEDLLSPFDASVATHHAKLAALSRTPGLLGTVVADTQPHGYEPENPDMQIGSYNSTVRDLWAFGYAPAARSAFFSKFGVDPIDLPDPNLPRELPLYSAAFPAADDLFEKWATFRAEANTGAIQSLLGKLKTPVHVDLRRLTHAQPPLGGITLLPYVPGAALPAYRDQFPVGITEGLGMIGWEPSDPMGERFATTIRAFGQMRAPTANAVTLDLTLAAGSVGNRAREGD